jgi:hypothetical protein
MQVSQRVSREFTTSELTEIKNHPLYQSHILEINGNHIFSVAQDVLEASGEEFEIIWGMEIKEKYPTLQDALAALSSDFL